MAGTLFRIIITQAADQFHAFHNEQKGLSLAGADLLVLYSDDMVTIGIFEQLDRCI
jgi:hypothetical protein